MRYQDIEYAPVSELLQGLRVLPQPAVTAIEHVQLPFSNSSLISDIQSLLKTHRIDSALRRGCSLNIFDSSEMTAFINVTSTGSFCTRSNSLPSQHRQTCSNLAPRMTANWSDDPGPAYSKYLSKIPMDRLNKAPVITINHIKTVFKNNQYDSVSVRLADMPADEAAGNAIKASITLSDEEAPDVSKWGAYYDPETVNEAPYINIYSSPLPFDKHAVSVVQTTVPCDIPLAKVLLGDIEPNPLLYKVRYQGRLNMAPYVTAVYRTSDEDSAVSVDTGFPLLNIVAANEILSKYRS